MIVDAGEVWWFELPRVGRKPGVDCSRRAVNLSLMPLAHELFLAGPAAPPLAPAGRLSARKLVELRRALAWTFSLAD